METAKKLHVLAKIAHALQAAGICWAVGGSLLLYFQQITTEFHDIDLMVKAGDAEAVKAILTQMGSFVTSQSKAKFKTKVFLEFVIEGVEVDVMAGFAVVKDGVEHDCSLREEDISQYALLENEKIPLHSVALWRKYYELMDNHAKVRLIDTAAETQ